MGRKSMIVQSTEGAFSPYEHTVCDAIRHWANRSPDAKALLSIGGLAVSYSALIGLIDHVRAALNEKGFGRGERLAIVHPSGPHLAALWLGVASGITAVPLKPSQSREEFIQQLAERSVDGVLIAAGASTAARDAAAYLSLPVIDVIWHGDNPEDGLTFRGDERRRAALPGLATPDDVALVLGTSGTTAKSKIMPIRHRAFAARLAATAQPLNLSPRDRGITLNPLYLHGGLSMSSTCLWSGGGVILMPGFDVEGFFQALTTLKTSWFHGSFAFMKEIVDYARAKQPPDIRGRLRFMRPTSGRIEREITDAMEEIFGAPVLEAFGSTETGRAACNPLPPGVRKPGTVGKPVNCEIQILGEDDEFLPPGQEGEILIRGINVIDAYENNDTANEEGFFDGWYRTGDTGFLDDDGYVTLTGRIREMINRGGEKIAPAEIDSALMQHPDITDAAAFAIPHMSLGEVVGAAVVMNSGRNVKKSEMQAFLKDLLSPIKRPVAYIFLDSIPRNAIGKIKRTELSTHYKRVA